ncbi:MAG: DUF554 domain-containing protein [Planctomycetia bacterium]|nr:DUF554 domain-containing protein [Planctomycetia bacterium]
MLRSSSASCSPAVIRRRSVAARSTACSIAAVIVIPPRPSPAVFTVPLVSWRARLASSRPRFAAATSREAAAQSRARARSGPNEWANPSGRSTSGSGAPSPSWGTAMGTTRDRPATPTCSPKRRAASRACDSARARSASSRSNRGCSSQSVVSAARLRHTADSAGSSASARASFARSRFRLPARRSATHAEYFSVLCSSFGSVVKQLGIGLLALVLGNVVGTLLRLQDGLNRLGQYAKERIAGASATDGNRFSEGFVTCTLLFCVGPMAILGAIEDGTNGNYRLLAIKAALDGLAAMGFAATFGPGVLLAALPVLAYQGTLTLAANALATHLNEPALISSIRVAGGLVVLCIAVVILELRKVPLANYLPSLVLAPLFTHWWK